MSTISTDRPATGPADIPAAWLRADLVVEGERRTAASYGPVDDPADRRRVVGEYADATPDEVAAAVAAATAAAAGWAATPAQRRAELMRAVADALDAHAESLIDLVTLEVGKVRAESTGDVRGAAGLLRSFAELAEEVETYRDLTGQPLTNGAAPVLLGRRPVGPVAVVSPWNTPLYLAFNCIAPALIAGCPVVVKPSEHAPLALTAALALAAAILPPGVIGAVPGLGATAGEALTSHPAIRAISFVGGIATGRRVMASAAPTLKKLGMELGGNDPALVLESARIDEAMVRELVAGSFAVSGQVCFNVKRIYVHRAWYAEFVAAYTAMVDQIVVGDGFDTRASFGPLTTEAGYRGALGHLERTRAGGARVLELGSLSDSADPVNGRFVRPHVVTGVAYDAPLVLEEQFAPIIPVLPFDTDDRAVAEANRTEFGLASSVWSADLDHAVAVARRIEAGNTFLNAHRVGVSPPLVPFGGVKQSGQGRNHLMYAVAECTEEHAIVGWPDTSRIPGLAPWAHLRLPEPSSAE